MRREIKFRGIDTESGEWIYGGYVLLKSGVNCILSGEVSHMALPDSRPRSPTYEELNVLRFHAVKYNTVGQFTGLKDSNGKEIFEGDAMLLDYGRGKRVAIVEYSARDGAFVFHTLADGFLHLCWEVSAAKDEVVGNIYENPELLEAVK